MDTAISQQYPRKHERFYYPSGPRWTWVIQCSECGCEMIVKQKRTKTCATCLDKRVKRAVAERARMRRAACVKRCVVCQQSFQARRADRGDTCSVGCNRSLRQQSAKTGNRARFNFGCPEGVTPELWARIADDLWQRSAVAFERYVERLRRLYPGKADKEILELDECPPKREYRREWCADVAREMAIRLEALAQ